LIIAVDISQLHIEVGKASIDCALNHNISQRDQCLVFLPGDGVFRIVPQTHLVTSLVGSDVVHFTRLLSNKFLAFDLKGDFFEPFRGLVYTCLFKPGFGLCGYQGPFVGAFLIPFLEQVKRNDCRKNIFHENYLFAGCKLLKFGAKILLLLAAIFEILAELVQILFGPETRAILERNKLFQAFLISRHR
jgi:hypothetical protein